MARRRRLRIALGAAGAVVALAAAVLLGLGAYWQRDLRRAIAELEREVGPLDRPPLFEGPLTDDNAATWLIAGADAIEPAESDEAFLASIRRRAPRTWSGEEVLAARELVARHASALQTMAKAVPLAHSRFPLRLGGASAGGQPSPEDPLPAILLRQIRGARVTLLAGYLALLDGDCGAAIASGEVLARQGAALGSEPVLIAPLIGTAITRGFLELGSEVLQGCSDAEDLDRLAAALDRLEETRWPADRVLAAEAVYSIGLLMADAREDPRRVSVRVPRWIARFTVERLALHADQWRAMVVASRAPWPELDRVVEERYRRHWPWQSSVRMLMPNFVHAVERLKLTDAAVRLARSAFAIRTEGLRTGAYPAPGALPDYALTPTPYVGEVPVYEVRSDGARVALPRSTAIWSQESGLLGTVEPMPSPPLVYDLPALALTPLSPRSLRPRA